MLLYPFCVPVITPLYYKYPIKIKDTNLLITSKEFPGSPVVNSLPTTNIQSKLKDTNLLKTFRDFPGSPAVKSLPAEAGHWV